MSKSSSVLKRIKQFFKYRHVDLDELMERHNRISNMLEQRSTFEDIGLLTASIEHEIRNPLSVIESEIDILKHKLQSHPDMITRLERIEEQKMRVFAATSIIPLLRANQGAFKKHASKINVHDLMNSCFKAVKGEVNATNIIFKHNDFRRYNSCFINAHRPMLQQAIINILKNSVEAIREAKRERGVVNTTAGNDSRSSKSVKIEIHDNGCGIQSDLAPKLTTLFTTRGDSKPNRGIGLFITNKIIEVHGGKLEIESKVGEGTLVTIFLPKEEGKGIKHGR
jgi:signal transduction histidine kinase